MRMYSSVESAKMLEISRQRFNTLVEKNNIKHCAEECRKTNKYTIKLRVFSLEQVEQVRKIIDDSKCKKEAKPIKLPNFISGTIPKSSSKPKVHLLDSYKNGAFSERMIKRNNAAYK